ncbi:MAG: NADPH-dependent 7-cyano-7-deazaguanine reductase QueF [Desulfovibrio sp.]|nr:NADPH-dependent 7-cyano-7-deazaguanine reductase QueF [Desulfovibrio sp.]
MSKSGDMIEGLSLLGKGSMPKLSGGPSRTILEAFPNKYPDRHYVVSIYFPEFTSLCPVTGQPDFGAIQVDYIPDELCVESKSFKLYMFAFRDHQSFMETIANAILDDLVAVLDPRWIRVKGLFAPRGATRLHVFVERFKPLETVLKEEVERRVESWRIEERR